MNKTQEFNKEYNLPTFNKNWFEVTSKEDYDAKAAKNTISGKTSKVGVDIIKRFFRNKWNIVFLVILTLIILFLIFGGLLVEHSDSKAVSTRTNLDYMRPGFDQGTHTVTGDVVAIKSKIPGANVVNGVVTAPPGVIQSAKWITVNGNSVWQVVFKNPNFVSTHLGTDSTGISVYARLVSSSRFSIGLAVLVTVVESVLGTVIGLYLGYNAGKALDTYFMRVIEVFTAVPALLLVTIFVLILGHGFTSMFLSLVLIGWVGPVYVARMFTIKVKDAEFIKASQSIGASQNRIIFRHIFPNVIGRVMVSFVYRIPAVIFIEATLVFLGIQVGGEAHNTLGTILNESRSIAAITNNPYFLISAVSVVLFFTLSLQIIANGLRDAFDAKVSS